MKAILNLFFPRTCGACNTVLATFEVHICEYCWLNLPATDYHLYQENELEKRFWGRVDIQRSAAYWYFRKDSSIQNLLHAIKYENQFATAMHIGEKYGAILANQADFKTVDYILPVPMHPSKESKRGYNQATYFGKGIEKSMNKKLVENVLIKQRTTVSQTHENRWNRWINTQEVFTLATKNASILEGKHVLLVDDVITTGATIERCVQALQGIDGITVSIAAMAVAIN